MSSAPRAHIAVLGLGAWGTALALHCARQGHRVTGWRRENRAVGASQLTTGHHLGEGVAIPSNLELTTALSDCQAADVVIIALPAKAWSEVLLGARFKIVVSATKGLESTTSSTPLTFLADTCGYRREEIAVISGPSFASDLAAARPLSLVAASASTTTAARVAELLSCSSLRVYTSGDPLGVELGGTLKNVIAIAAGVSDALSFGPSARAALISRGLAEMMRLATRLGADGKTLAGLSGLGDLIMSATEDQSRNRTVGLRLGRGEPLKDILASLRATAEGVNTAPLVQRIARTHGVQVPITDFVVELLNGTSTPKQLVEGLMNRPLKSEF